MPAWRRRRRKCGFPACWADGNRVLRPSPLLAGLPLAELLASATGTLARQEAVGRRGRRADWRCPGATGGTGREGFRRQLAAARPGIWPAWAYYQYRLGGEAMEEPVKGLIRRRAARLVHAALEALWSELRSSEALAALSAGAPGMPLPRRSPAPAGLRDGSPDVPPGPLRELEAARLHKLLDLWLDVEGPGAACL